MDSGHSAEYISAHWGALRAGHEVSLLPSSAVDSIETLRQKILAEQPSILLVSPNHSTLLLDSGEQAKKKDLLAKALPEVFEDFRLGAQGLSISCETAPELRFLIQTGFYSLPCFLKYRDVLVYRSNKYNTSVKLPDFLGTSPDPTDLAKTCPTHAFSTLLTESFSGKALDDAMVFNVLNLQEEASANALLGSLRLSDERGLFTNVIPSESLDELLLEKRFLSDLSAQHEALIVGTSYDLEKVSAALKGERVRFLDVSSV